MSGVIFHYAWYRDRMSDQFSSTLSILQGVAQNFANALAIYFFVRGREATGHFGCLLGAPPPIALICPTPCIFLLKVRL